MDSDMLRKVLAYIDDHIYEKINLPELAELVGYSPFYFSKLFSDAMGMEQGASLHNLKSYFATRPFLFDIFLVMLFFGSKRKLKRK